MNYERLYDELIDSASKRGQIDGVYGEFHHIVPKCLGGSNDSSNLIWLTAQEHFMAHFYLWKIHNEPKLALAFSFMVSGVSKCSPREIDVNEIENFSHEYQNAKNEWSKHMSSIRLGTKHSKETRDRISKSHTGKVFTQEHIANMSKANMGKKLSQETKDKISAGNKGKSRGPLSGETKRLLSEAHSGKVLSSDHKSNIKEAWKNVEVKTCPHCGKQGKNNMTRYHFDNCKHKKLS